MHERGTLDGLVLEAAERPVPGAGEAVVAVRATGLNFRDVLNVLGMYPGPAGSVGTECAGVVVAVGDDVTDVAVGDEVIALVEGGFARHVVAPAHLVFRLPAGLDFAAGASIPIAFLTAQLGLHELAGMGKGDTVLVHAAAGGVGLAAVQLAQRAGATVIGTAGSAEKRAFLRSIGVAHVFDSRSLDFAGAGHGGHRRPRRGHRAELPRRTRSSAPPWTWSPRVARSWRSASGTSSPPQQAAERRPDVRYHLYDLSDVIVGQPERLRRMMEELLGRIEAGELAALPHRCFGIDDVRGAFRHMAMARHVGKVVVTQPGGAEAGVEPGQAVSSDATYLITGGLGGLGLEAARTLVDQGARHLALLARRSPSAEVDEALDGLRAAGAEVLVLSADISRRADVARALAEVREAMPPLRGIIHAAGVLDDVLVRQAEWSHFETVLGAKVAGAWHLHELTAADRLDFFVLYSSTASLLGAAGQANYAAANAFLDALAHHRRALGLPGTSVNWGAWSTVGMAARLAGGSRRRIGRRGVRLIDPADGGALLPGLLMSSAAQVGVVPISWARVAEESGDVLRRPFLELMAAEVTPPRSPPRRGASWTSSPRPRRRSATALVRAPREGRHRCGARPRRGQHR